MYDKVVYELDWVVPVTGSTGIGSVRAKLMPPTIAAQVLIGDVAQGLFRHKPGADKKNAALTLLQNTIQATDAVTGKRHCRSGEVPGWQAHRRRGAVSEFVGVVEEENQLISDQLSVAHFESPVSAQKDGREPRAPISDGS